jgi:membrane protease YdiL (CAAX protease family)
MDNSNLKQFTFIHAIGLIVLLGIIPVIINWFIIFANRFDIYPQSWNTFIVYVLSFCITLFIAKKWWQIISFDTQKVNFLVYILLIPIIFSLSITVESLANLIPMPDKIRLLFEQMIQFNLPSYLTIGIAAPLLEEFIFRGIVLKKFLLNYSPTKAIVLSSVIFGIAHLNPWQFIGAFFMGLLIGWIYWKTKSIWPGIFIHFTNNSFSFFVAKKYDDINITFNDIIGNTYIYISILIASVILCYIMLKVLNKYLSKQNNTLDVYNQ